MREWRGRRMRWSGRPTKRRTRKWHEPAAINGSFRSWRLRHFALVKPPSAVMTSISRRAVFTRRRSTPACRHGHGQLPERGQRRCPPARHDFDFLVGDWEVDHRRLQHASRRQHGLGILSRHEPLRPPLGGAGNVERKLFPICPVALTAASAASLQRKVRAVVDLVAQQPRSGARSRPAAQGVASKAIAARSTPTTHSTVGRSTCVSSGRGSTPTGGALGTGLLA